MWRSSFGVIRGTPAVAARGPDAGIRETARRTINRFLDGAPSTPAGSGRPNRPPLLRVHRPRTRRQRHHRAPSSGSRWKAATTIRTTSRNPRRHRDCAPGNAPSERSEHVGAPVEDSPAATTRWSDGCSVACLTQGVPDTRRLGALTDRMICARPRLASRAPAGQSGAISRCCSFGRLCRRTGGYDADLLHQ